MKDKIEQTERFANFLKDFQERSANRKTRGQKITRVADLPLEVIENRNAPKKKLREVEERLAVLEALVVDLLEEIKGQSNKEVKKLAEPELSVTKEGVEPGFKTVQSSGKKQLPAPKKSEPKADK